MYCAFGGIGSWSASSTARTDAIAWTVVQTPQKRCANTHASRGSRPRRIVSMPRHIVHETRESVTWPPSTTTSTRRCPSMRVTGSIVSRVAMRVESPFGVIGACRRHQAVPRRDRRGEDRERLNREAEPDDCDRDPAKHDEQLRQRREIDVLRAAGPVREGGRREAIEEGGEPREGRHVVEDAWRLAHAARAEDERRDQEADVLGEEEHTVAVERERRTELTAPGDVREAEPEPEQARLRQQIAELGQDRHVNRPLPVQARRHQGEDDRGEAAHEGLDHVEDREPRRLPQGMDLPAGEREKRAERRLVHRWQD